MSGERMIKPIDKAAVHRICSGQVILDLAMAVKELVENSLDAGATSIEIKLKDYGAESVEVADNGCGVSPQNYQALTLKYHTSKISDFADLQSLSSFGFRGEALSSLCALADVSIVTRTKDEPFAAHLKFDHSGLLVSQESEARPVGTNVIISKLFSTLPVRHKEFNRNIRREYSRLLAVLQAYALIAKGVRLLCTHITGKSNRSIILKTQGTDSVKDNIITVFGTKMAACLEQLELSMSDQCRIEGFVSKAGAGCGRASGDRQFFYINGRPVDMPKVAKLLNELYRSFNSQQYPMAVLNFVVAPTAYDVNVTPDKRKVFLHEENIFITALRELLEKIYVPSRYTYVIHKPECSVLEKDTSLAVDLIEFETQKSLSDVDEDVDALPGFDADVSGIHDTEGLLERTGLGNGSLDQNDKGERMDLGDIEEMVQGKRDVITVLPPVDLSSFKCPSVSGSAKTPGTSLVAGGQSKSRIHSDKCNVPSIHQKVTQSKLTGFLNQVKKQPEDGLLSEEPLLKHWTVSSAKNAGKTSSLGVTKHHGTLFCPVTGVLRPHKRETSLHCNSTNSDRLELEDSIPHSPGCEDGIGNCSKDVHVNEDEETPSNKEEDEDQDSILNTTSVCEASVSLPMDNNGAVCESVDLTSGTGTESHVVDADNTGNAFSTLSFNLEKLRSKIKRGLFKFNGTLSLSKGKRIRKRKFFTAATTSLDDAVKEGSEKEEALAAAVRELEKTFDKADFKRMKVVGQFNLGFILAKLDQDLFIIDQHASDEKYNFERLSKSTVLNRQPLLRPLPLDLSAAEEVVVSMHIETFRLYFILQIWMHLGIAHMADRPCAIWLTLHQLSSINEKWSLEFSLVYSDPYHQVGCTLVDFSYVLA
eukprot:c27788_g1_i2 orf=360-2978(-)